MPHPSQVLRRASIRAFVARALSSSLPDTAPRWQLTTSSGPSPLSPRRRLSVGHLSQPSPQPRGYREVSHA
ncbi:hypothetical protein K523DRAFT_99089 [Schizophyllum commune Tattone D]|nr:hypothetical protein K523DRAFT_99089 [Schizophyllum commune Tattone D]